MNQEMYTEKLKQAKVIYLDLIDLMSTEESINRLLASVPGKDLLALFDDLEHMFVKAELYEKCKRIIRWREKINSRVSPYKTFHHLY